MTRRTRKKKKIRQKAAKRLPVLWLKNNGICENCGEPTLMPRYALACGWRWAKQYGWLKHKDQRVRGASIEHLNGVFAGNNDDNLRLFCMPCNHDFSMG